MGADQNLDWRHAVASALEWWHDAGVDTLVDDLPRNWLVAPALPVVDAPAGSPGLPATLAALLDWRRGAHAPEAGWSGVAVEASGPADARVMVLVDCPDRADEGAGLLSGGDAGRLFERMLAAIGLSRETVHIAAVCLRRPPPGRMPDGLDERLGEVARHHVALVRPERLLVLGNSASRAMLGTDIARARGGLRTVGHDGGETGVVASWHPRILLDRPAAKGEAWKDLQMLVGGMT